MDEDDQSCDTHVKYAHKLPFGLALNGCALYTKLTNLRCKRKSALTLSFLNLAREGSILRPAFCMHHGLVQTQRI